MSPQPAGHIHSFALRRTVTWERRCECGYPEEKALHQGLIAKLTIVVSKEHTTTKIQCGENKTFEQVLAAMIIARAELDRQITERQKCPANTL